MIAKTTKKEYYSLKEFLTEAMEKIEESFSFGWYDLVKLIKDDMLRKRVIIKTNDIRRIINILHKLPLTKQEEQKYIEYVCEKADILCKVEHQKDKTIIEYIEIPRFTTGLFKNIAFLDYIHKEYSEEFQNISDQDWKEFKLLYENEDMPEDLHQKILEFREKLLSKIEEKYYTEQEPEREEDLIEYL